VLLVLLAQSQTDSSSALNYIEITANYLVYDADKGILVAVPAGGGIGTGGLGGGYLSPGPTQDQLDRIDNAIDQMYAAQKAMNDALSANPRTGNNPYYSIEYNTALGDLGRANALYDQAMRGVSSGTSASPNPSDSGP